MKNEQVAQIFRNMARLLDLKEDNFFRVRAYDKAADLISGLGKDIADLAEAEELEQLSGIGHDLAEKIKAIISTGTCPQYESLKKEMPFSLLQLFKIPGLGPKSIKLFYRSLKIDSPEKLEKAALSGKLLDLPGVKEKTVANVLNGIALLKKRQERLPLPEALSAADIFVSALQKIKTVKKCQIAGSLRRRRDTVKDIDILVSASSPEKIMTAFTSLPQVKQVLARGETKASIICDKHDLQVDLRVVEEKCFGSALLYFTGSKQFNIKLRHLAIEKKLKLSEYGVFDAKENFLAGRSEKEIFSLLGLEFIPPEMREDRGEVELALNRKLPVLAEAADLQGDFHVHSVYSDGKATLAENAAAAQKMNYSWLGLVDHSPSLRIAGGLPEEKVYQKIEEIKKMNKKLKGLTLLCGTEVDILKDGTLDYPDSLLKEFDLVIAAVHTGFKQSREQMTERLVKACKNKYVHILAHPTGRILGGRSPYDFDFDEVCKAAAGSGVAMEINSCSERMDLNDLLCLQAKNHGLKFALGTDAHTLTGLHTIGLGLSIARRAWLTEKDLLNYRTLKELKKWLKK